MKAALYILGSLLFICFAGMAFTAVLLDHGLGSRLLYDLFAMAGILAGLPALLIAIFND